MKARDFYIEGSRYVGGSPFIINEISLAPIFNVNELLHNSYIEHVLYEKIPFQKLFIELDKPFHTVIEAGGMYGKRELDILGVFVQDMSEDYYAIGSRLSKYPAEVSTNKIQKRFVSMVCHNKSNNHMEFGHYYSYLDNEGELIVGLEFHSVSEHIKHCNCLEGNLWDDMNKQSNESYAMQSLSSKFMNELDGGKEFQKHPPCKQLAELVRFEYNIRNIIACINSKGFERVTKKQEKKAKSMFSQKSPIQYKIRLSNGVYIANDGEQKAGHGTKHRYQYSVRGHFRDTEKFGIIWVKPHKRGINHAITIPKEYVLL